MKEIQAGFMRDDVRQVFADLQDLPGPAPLVKAAQDLLPAHAECEAAMATRPGANRALVLVSPEYVIVAAAKGKNPEQVHGARYEMSEVDGAHIRGIVTTTVVINTDETRLEFTARSYRDARALVKAINDHVESREKVSLRERLRRRIRYVKVRAIDKLENL